MVNSCFLLLNLLFLFFQNQGTDLADSELLDYISESNTMSKSLVDYGEQKSCAVTTAKRLADFLGPAMVREKGLRCTYVIAQQPQVNHDFLLFLFMLDQMLSVVKYQY